MIKNRAKFNFEDLFILFGQNDLHNINNDILVECEYMCEDHKNKFILDLFNKPLRLQQQKEYIDFSL